MQPIDDATCAALREHFTTRQVLEITFTCGLNQMISRFHAAVRTDVDAETVDRLGTSCPVRLPALPADGVALPAGGVGLPADGPAVPPGGPALPTDGMGLPDDGAV